jgi:hypothetical protein
MTAAPTAEHIPARAAAPVATASGARDLRLDFFRGLSLFFIFIDHIPENVFAYFTLHAIAFCDAAEVFIFISGYTAALVYGASLKRSGALYATAQIYRRVWQLYVAHIFIFVIFTAEVSYTVIAAQNPMYTEEMGVGDFLAQPHIAIIHALFLDFQPTFLDILPLYIVLLGAFPLILLGLHLHPLLSGVVSALLYILALAHGWAFHASGKAWFFNPLAWQFLFVVGASFGYAATGVRQMRIPLWLQRLAVATAGIILLINLTWDVHWFYDPFTPIFLRLWYLTLDKTNLAPLRLVSFLALAGSVIYFVKRDSGFLRSRAARPLIVCGQNSLYVFCLGIVLSVFAHVVLSEINAGLVMQITVNFVGMALMIGTAFVLDWFKRAGRRPASAPRAPSEGSP